MTLNRNMETFLVEIKFLLGADFDVSSHFCSLKQHEDLFSFPFGHHSFSAVILTRALAFVSQGNMKTFFLKKKWVSGSPILV